MVSSHSNRFKIMSQDHTSLSLHPFPPALDVASLYLQTLPHSPSNRTGHPVSMALPTSSTESSGQRESVGEGTLRLRRLSSSVDTHCLKRFQALSHTALKSWISVTPGRWVCPSADSGAGPSTPDFMYPSRNTCCLASSLWF